MNDRMIENPLYQGMSLKNLLETTDLFQIPGLVLDENGVSKDASKKKDGPDMYKPTAAFLGPDIWDNTQKMSLEYMDLDEFLNENNIPLDMCMSPGESDQQQQQQQQEQCISPSPVSPSRTLSMIMGGDTSPLRGSFSPQSSSDEDSMQFINPVTIERRDRDTSPDPDSLPAEIPMMSQIRTENSTNNSNFIIKVISKPSVPASFSVPKVLPPKKLVDVNFSLVESDLALATVPGIDFDPRKRAFTDEELKPQPMIKKSRKQYVPAEQKDEHYWSRRNKNNYAAKRSREARRMKENQIAMRANYLEKENSALTLELTKYKTELNLLKKRLAMYENST